MSAPSDGSQWVPLPLRTWFWVSYACVLVAGAIGLEVALHFSNKHNGWSTLEDAEKGVLHYVYTLPPVAVTMALVGIWAWTVAEVTRLQPYVDLMHGGSLPRRSLLLDYTRTKFVWGIVLSLHWLRSSSNALVWVKATSNRHYIVALASLTALVVLSFQPVSAALFIVRDVYMALPEKSVNNLQAISLNQNEQVQDLTIFLGASGLASASILYGLGDPPFVYDGYTIGKFELPLNLTNGTLKANTTAILSDPGCKDPDQPVVITQPFDNTWQGNVTFGDCEVTWSANGTPGYVFGVNTIGNCPGISNNSSFAPAIFWFFVLGPDPLATVTMCSPRITLLNVEATVDLASTNLTHVESHGNLTAGQGPFTQYAGSITGAPLYGQAYNGLNWTESVTYPVVDKRAAAIQLQLPAAVYQNAVQSTEGLAAAFASNTLSTLTTTVYRTYLSNLASLLYFVTAPQPMNVTVSTFQTRFFLADEAAHLLSAGMLLLSVFGTIIHLLHRRDRRGLRLLHTPGTLASAAALTGQTPIAELLDGQQRPEEMNQALRNLRFRMDPLRMKVVTEGEADFEDAQRPSLSATPNAKGP